MSETVAVPAWILEPKHHGEYFLLCLSPNGVSVDGGHDKPAGVATARHLIESLACISKHPDRRYVMVRVMPMPEKRGKVNRKAIDALNAIALG
jgi:hypothetical protein